ncbi:MAG: fluoride efflux transporter CrcB [Magnetococcales bacterium]|nr:fluoride efflux transporter CrcB [Magnetococcales bacterium]
MTVRMLMMVGVGGAFGAMARYSLSMLVSLWLGKGFPWGTLAVNLVGSLLMGVLAALFLQLETPEPWRLMVFTGFLGALTTFSAFSIETLTLLQSGQFTVALFNILLNVTLCIAAVWLGMLIVRYSF